MWKLEHPKYGPLILQDTEIYAPIDLVRLTDEEMKQLTDEELNELPGGAFAILVKGLDWFKETSSEDGSYVIRKETARKTLFILERLPDDTLHGYVGPTL